ncbi:uncharacterized protein MONOS_11661 [Monocercomonoides exilis]|uniref:uncharacterized protein n=1 Tax=Monocercomonoides exilis TaxID=2049356 RepID=UPI003559D640|nr:hypothetical protein MONOS_11661 [Monocercomonoides exilis]|eukprot:MONOS_11661.1-p1 / transcript=MONOS_11661.1 / gene=MONOS_11661 / organism=Monocercomonoides_exilis_PA203 / gene_product=unspecified product / transcript_product=unspecified product / location=Mono_scaffold00598:37129-37719(+) / protein_length=197 / sequence_SO=supercontig / SO=protein_coding / is_pseudo=false
MAIPSDPQMAMPMGMQIESEYMRNVFTSASCVSSDFFGDDELCTWKEKEKIPVAKFQQVENMKEYRENQYHRVASSRFVLIEWNHFFLDYARHLFGCAGEWVGRDARECRRAVHFVSANVIEYTDSFASAAFAAALTDVCVHPVCVEKAIEMRGGRASASIWSMDTAVVLFVKEMEEFEGGKEGTEEGEGEKERER